jgi:hypothetical protein
MCRKSAALRALLKTAVALVDPHKGCPSFVLILHWNGNQGQLARELGEALASKYRCQVTRWRRFEYELHFGEPRAYVRSKGQLAQSWHAKEAERAGRKIAKAVQESEDFAIKIHKLRPSNSNFWVDANNQAYADCNAYKTRLVKELCKELATTYTCQATMGLGTTKRWVINIHKEQTAEQRNAALQSRAAKHLQQRIEDALKQLDKTVQLANTRTFKVHMTNNLDLFTEIGTLLSERYQAWVIGERREEKVVYHFNLDSTPGFTVQTPEQLKQRLEQKAAKQQQAALARILDDLAHDIQEGAKTMRSFTVLRQQSLMGCAGLPLPDLPPLSEVGQLLAQRYGCQVQLEHRPEAVVAFHFDLSAPCLFEILPSTDANRIEEALEEVIQCFEASTKPTQVQLSTLYNEATLCVVGKKMSNRYKCAVVLRPGLFELDWTKPASFQAQLDVNGPDSLGLTEHIKAQVQEALYAADARIKWRITNLNKYPEVWLCLDDLFVNASTYLLDAIGNALAQRYHCWVKRQLKRKGEKVKRQYYLNLLEAECYEPLDVEQERKELLGELKERLTRELAARREQRRIDKEALALAKQAHQTALNGPSVENVVINRSLPQKSATATAEPTQLNVLIKRDDVRIGELQETINALQSKVGDDKNIELTVVRAKYTSELFDSAEEERDAVQAVMRSLLPFGPTQPSKVNSIIVNKNAYSISVKA